MEIRCETCVKADVCKLVDEMKKNIENIENIENSISSKSIPSNKILKIQSEFLMILSVN